MNPNEIQMIDVVSSQIKKIGHDTDSKMLYVLFHTCPMPYKYPEFPAEKFEEFRTAESVGKFFNANIRKQFKCIPPTDEEKADAHAAATAVTA